jgi:16S rRNA (adenine1518-N6/adenine1519-N6)-dimethyltransferase
VENFRKKSLGQCFLEDKNILALEAKLAHITGKRALEIGPGDGRLTEALLAEKPEKLFAVEMDPRFATALREKFANETKTGIIEIIEGDFLEVKIPGVDIVIGNIPYYISSDIVFTLAKLPIERAVLMVQKEFAMKMVAKAGDDNYGRLSVTAQLAFDVRIERKVPAHLFRPMPKVDSAIIVLKPTGFRISALQENVIRALYQHKNKTARNALIYSKMFETKDLEEKLGNFVKRRARTLTKEECLEIANLLA